MKTCSKCKVEKDIDCFRNRYGKNNKITKRPECNECHFIKQKQYRQENPEKFRYAKLKLDYGITKEEYDVIFKEQNGCCAICNLPETRKHAKGKLLSLSVDHDHKTGKTRGLLCSKCNTSFGLLNEDAQTIEKMLEYKIKHTEFVWKWISA